jgi:hypothetical protein
MDLLAEQTHEAAKEANTLHLNWLRKHPDDAIALDAGEIVAMTVSSYENDEPGDSTQLPTQQYIATT